MKFVFLNFYFFILKRLHFFSYFFSFKIFPVKHPLVVLNRLDKQSKVFDISRSLIFLQSMLSVFFLNRLKLLCIIHCKFINLYSDKNSAFLTQKKEHYIE